MRLLKPVSAIPQLSNEAFEDAKNYLRAIPGFDFDTFQEGATVSALLFEPLGSTPECLTADEISRLEECELDSPLARRVVGHVTNCRVCAQLMASYNEASKKVALFVAHEGVSVCPYVWIEPQGKITAQNNLELSFVTAANYVRVGSIMEHLPVNLYSPTVGNTVVPGHSRLLKNEGELMRWLFRSEKIAGLTSNQYALVAIGSFKGGQSVIVGQQHEPYGQTLVHLGGAQFRGTR